MVVTLWNKPDLQLVYLSWKAITSLLLDFKTILKCFHRSAMNWCTWARYPKLTQRALQNKLNLNWNIHLDVLPLQEHRLTPCTSFWGVTPAVTRPTAWLTKLLKWRGALTYRPNSQLHQHSSCKCVCASVWRNLLLLWRDWRQQSQSKNVQPAERSGSSSYRCHLSHVATESTQRWLLKSHDFQFSAPKHFIHIIWYHMSHHIIYHIISFHINLWCTNCSQTIYGSFFFHTLHL